MGKRRVSRGDHSLGPAGRREVGLGGGDLGRLALSGNWGMEVYISPRSSVRAA